MHFVCVCMCQIRFVVIDTGNQSFLERSKQIVHSISLDRWILLVEPIQYFTHYNILFRIKPDHNRYYFSNII